MGAASMQYFDPGDFELARAQAIESLRGADYIFCCSIKKYDKKNPDGSYESTIECPVYISGNNAAIPLAINGVIQGLAKLSMEYTHQLIEDASEDS